MSDNNNPAIDLALMVERLNLNNPDLVKHVSMSIPKASPVFLPNNLMARKMHSQ